MFKRQNPKLLSTELTLVCRKTIASVGNLIYEKKLNSCFFLDSESAADARRWASLAIGHHSLLELLNFPSDQKYGC